MGSSLKHTVAALFLKCNSFITTEKMTGHMQQLLMLQYNNAAWPNPSPFQRFARDVLNRIFTINSDEILLSLST